MSDRYDEKAQVIVNQLNESHWPMNNYKTIAAALRESAAEAFGEAASMCNEKFGQGVPGNMTPALYARAAALRSTTKGKGS